jgi:hypothetical protein
MNPETGEIVHLHTIEMLPGSSEATVAPED